MLKVTIKQGNIKQIVSRFKGFQKNVRKLAIDRTYYQSRARIRITKKSPDGQRWQRLRPMTIEAKGDSSILVERGNDTDLYNSLVRGIDRVTANAKHAATHQFGSPSRRIPARPFLGLDPKEKVFERKLTALWERITK